MQELVYLVRHGESEWNVRGVTQGQTVHPRLTARGREQMVTAAERIKCLTSGRKVGLITSSDLDRAVEGADILSQLLGAGRSEDIRLRERSFGLFQGTKHARTLAWTTKASKLALAHGGVEDAGRVRLRAHVALAGLAPGTTHVVVGHGEFFRLLPGGADLGVVGNGDVVVWDGASVRRT